jgi:hypothetical protein
MPADITFTDPRGNTWTFEGMWKFEMVGADYESKTMMGRLRPGPDGSLEPPPAVRAAVEERVQKLLSPRSGSD